MDAVCRWSHAVLAGHILQNCGIAGLRPKVSSSSRIGFLFGGVDLQYSFGLAPASVPTGLPASGLGDHSLSEHNVGICRMCFGITEVPRLLPLVSY